MNNHAKATIGALLLALLWALPASAQQGVAVGEPYGQWFLNDGTVCNACKLYFYIAGSATPLDTYSDAALTTPNANPVILSAYGRALIFLSDRSYKVTLTTSAGVEIWTTDNYVGRAPPANVLAKTADYTVAVTDGKDVLISADASGGTFTVNLFTAVGNSGRRVSVIKTDASANSITIDANGAQTINGALTQSVGSRYASLSMISDGANWLIIYETINQDPVAGPCNGRLTATTAVPITTSDVTAATSVYFTPYRGNECWVYDGSASWTQLTFSELTISLSGCTASRPYDVFVYNNGGTLAAETLIWTNATTRATALAVQNGRYVKSGTTTRRYAGTVYCNASGGQTDDTLAKRYVFNAEHRVCRPVRVLETTNSWTYTTATWRQANGAAGNQIDVMVGLADGTLRAEVAAEATNSGSAATGMVRVAIGEDSTSAPMLASVGRVVSLGSGNTIRDTAYAAVDTFPAVGFHFYAWLEHSIASNTTTWYGDDGGTLTQSGMTGQWCN